MILKDLNVKKTIVIKTKSPSTMMTISKMIHNQLVGKRDYIDSNIILSIGDGSNNEIPENEIHLYIFDNCKEDIPTIVIGKFPTFIQVIIDISVRDVEEEGEVLEDMYKQLAGNKDYISSKIVLNSSRDRNDSDINGNCIRIIYNDNRWSTPSLILL